MRAQKRDLRGLPARGGDNDAGGYTLIELTVVVAIIAVLASIAIPGYIHYRKKALSTEARAQLHAISKLEFSYFTEYSSYTTSLSDIGFVPVPGARYTYTVDAADHASFTASATANLDGDAVLDIWWVNQKGVYSHQSID